MNFTRRYLADLAERAGRTFVQAYLAAWTASPIFNGDAPSFDTMLTAHNLQFALAAAVYSVLTSLAAKQAGNPESASALPPELQPPAPVPADPNPEAPKVVVTEATNTTTLPRAAVTDCASARMQPRGTGGSWVIDSGGESVDERLRRARQEAMSDVIAALAANNLEAVAGPPAGRHSRKQPDPESQLAPWLRGR